MSWPYKKNNQENNLAKWQAAGCPRDIIYNILYLLLIPSNIRPSMVQQLDVLHPNVTDCLLESI